MPEIAYRPAQETDAPEIARIHVASWRDAYESILDPAFMAGPIEIDRREHWASKLRDASTSLNIEVAFQADQNLIGFIAFNRGFDPRWGSFVDNLHVLPCMRGKKVGESLLRLAAGKILSGGLYLWVFEANSAAVRFYERLGGRIVEQAQSQIPAADKKTILRLHWPVLSPLL